tara:strand:- start:23 stop:709 length:687 start_codon:yes stop_codon:yes gene_type:complete
MNRLRNKLFIFDKDGTLNHFNKSFIPWIKEVVCHIDKNIQLDIFKTLGVNIKNNTLFSSKSPFAIETHTELKTRIKPCVSSCTVVEAQLIYHKLDNLSINQVPVDNITSIINSLMVNNKVALYTSDNYLHTHNFIRKNNLSFNSIIHSESNNFASKTNLSTTSIDYLMNIYNIYGKENVFFISDTINDIKIGNKANIGTIGVLSGTGSKKELQEFSDIVVDDINYLLI